MPCCERRLVELIVAEDRRLLGVLALKDLLQFFRYKLELDDREETKA